LIRDGENLDKDYNNTHVNEIQTVINTVESKEYESKSIRKSTCEKKESKIFKFANSYAINKNSNNSLNKNSNSIKKSPDRKNHFIPKYNNSDLNNDPQLFNSNKTANNTPDTLVYNNNASSSKKHNSINDFNLESNNTCKDEHGSIPNNNNNNCKLFESVDNNKINSQNNNISANENMKKNNEMQNNKKFNMDRSAKNSIQFQFKPELFNKEVNEKAMPNIQKFKNGDSKYKNSANSDSHNKLDNSFENVKVGVKMPFINNYKNAVSKERTIFKNSPINKAKKAAQNTISQDFSSNAIIQKITNKKPYQNRNNLLLSLDENNLYKEKKKYINKYSKKINCSSEYSENALFLQIKNFQIKSKNNEESKKEKQYESKKTQSMDFKNDISFAGECSKIVIDDNYDYKKEISSSNNLSKSIKYKDKSTNFPKNWKIVDFDYDKHKKIFRKYLEKNETDIPFKLKNMNKEANEPKEANNHLPKNFNIKFANSNINKSINSFPNYLEDNEKFKLNEILNSTGNLNHNVNNTKMLSEKIDLCKNNYQKFSDLNSNQANETKNERYGNNYKIPNKTYSNFAFKKSDKNIYKFNDSSEDEDDENKLIKESLKPEVIGNIMKRVLENTKKELASKTRDFLKNIPQNYMNLAKSQQRIYIINSQNNKKGDRPTTTDSNIKKEILNHYEYNLNHKIDWKKHEDFWDKLAKIDVNNCPNYKNIDIEQYIFPPNDEDILLSFYCRMCNIDRKFTIDESLEAPFDEINKWKNAYKKVVMRWHPDKLNPILDQINVDDDVKIRLNKKAGIIINNMNKNLRNTVGLLKRIMLNKDFTKNCKKN